MKKVMALRASGLMLKKTIPAYYAGNYESSLKETISGYIVKSKDYEGINCRDNSITKGRFGFFRQKELLTTDIKQPYHYDSWKHAFIVVKDGYEISDVIDSKGYLDPNKKNLYTFEPYYSAQSSGQQVGWIIYAILEGASG
jgi:hypothetical protein